MIKTGLRKAAANAIKFSIFSGVVYCLWLFLFSPAGNNQTYVSAIVTALPVVLRVYLAILMIQLYTLETALRRAWVCLTIGGAALIVAEPIYIFLGHPAISIADIFFLVFYMFSIPGLFLLPFEPAATREEKSILLLDFCIVMFACPVILWYFLFEPILQLAITENYAQLLNLVYPILDLFFMASAIIIIQRNVRGIPSVSLVCIALTGGFGIVLDAIVVSTPLISGSLEAKIYDSIIITGRTLYLAALYYQIRFLEDPDPLWIRGSARRFLRLALPYIASTLCLAVSIQALVASDVLTVPLRGVLYGTIGLTALVLYRQFLVLRQNLKLLEKENQARRESEEAVEKLNDLEKELQDSVQRFRLVSRATNDVIWDWNLVDGWVWRSSAMFSQFDSQPNELLPGTESWHRKIHPDDRARVVSGLDQLIQSEEQHWSAEYRVRKKDNTYADIFDRGFVIRDSAGKAVRMVGAMMDITHRKAAEAALKESEEKYRALFEESKDIVYISSPDGKILDINPAGLLLFGYSTKEEMLAPDASRNLYANPADRESYMHEISGRGFVKDFEKALITKDGRKLRVTDTATVIRDSNGSIKGYRGIIRDVTHLTELQDSLIQFGKIEAVGRLAGGIAHDFNNLLMAIGSYCEIVLMKLHKNDPLKKEVEQIRAVTDKGADLTRQLLAFSRKQVMAPRIIPLNQIVSNTENMLRRLIGEDIQLRIVLSDDPGSVNVDPVQVEQIIVNLAVNARDAMPKGGRLVFETANISESDVSAETQMPVKPGPYVMLAVSDSGSGMDRETLEHIFEPFYTTKETGKGTGLGLATVYGIVKQSDGYTTVHSQPGQGSTFRVCFPRVAPGSQQTQTRTVELSSTITKGKKILLVDDHNDVRGAVASALELSGFEVKQAKDAIEAQKIMELNEGLIHLLIADVVMPGVSGIELAQVLQSRYPELRVLFMSGYAEEAIRLRGKLSPGTTFLSKPVTVEDLLTSIREMI